MIFLLQWMEILKYQAIGKALIKSKNEIRLESGEVDLNYLYFYLPI